MPRHVVKESRWEEDTINREMRSMNTYEDAYRQLPDRGNSKWRKKLYKCFNDIVWPPNPAKIYQITENDDDVKARSELFFTGVKKEKVDDDDYGNQRYPLRREVLARQKEEEVKYEDVYRTCRIFTYLIRTMFFSRIYILLLQYISSNIFGNMFHTDAFRMTDIYIARGYSRVGDYGIGHFLGGLRRWDAQYFLFLIDGDYVYEPTLMFFPGFVAFVTYSRMGIKFIFELFGYKPFNWAITAYLAVVINLIFFHIAGVFLYQIAYRITKNEKIALLAVSIYSYNPASIFFTAAYSEAGFAMCTFYATNLAVHSVDLEPMKYRFANTILASTFFAVSVLFRSNGLTNLGFALWFLIGAMVWQDETEVYDVSPIKKRVGLLKTMTERDNLQGKIKDFEKRQKMRRKQCTCAVFTVSFFTVLLAFIICSPYVYYGNSITQEFCNPKGPLAIRAAEWNRVRPTGLVLAGQPEKTTWCSEPHIYTYWPTFYAHIQAKYWDVKLFGYWQIKKIPCFLLALPAMILTFLAIRDSLLDVFRKRRWFNLWVMCGRVDHLVPFALHASVLMFVAVFYINVEVFTRIIFSSTPFLYIYLAMWMDELTKGNTPGNRFSDYQNSYSIVPFFIKRRVWDSGWTGKLFYIYFLSYFVFGTMAHAAWLPFT